MCDSENSAKFARVPLYPMIVGSRTNRVSNLAHFAKKRARRTIMGTWAVADCWRNIAIPPTTAGESVTRTLDILRLKQHAGYVVVLGR